MKTNNLQANKATNALLRKAGSTYRVFSMLVLLLVISFTAKANPIDENAARQVGAQFVNGNLSPRATADSFSLAATYSTDNGTVAFRVFNMENGYVIVAADDCATPILGYSTTGQFDPNNLPIQMEEYLQGFVSEIQYAFDHNIQGNEQTVEQWNAVRTVGRLSIERDTRSVSPLLTDTWYQGCYYNAHCPEDAEGPCDHVWTGCVATSMAQIMHYWSYPQTGTGSHSYTPDGYPTQTVDFGATTYDWANMPNSLNANSTSAQKEAVSTLMWHCGVAVDMSYGTDGSGANTSKVVTALKDYFGYAESAHMVDRQTTSNQGWLELIKSNLDKSWPVLYRGRNASGGHAFVCDGYDNNNLLHFNFGWGGASNDYFAIGAILGETGYNFANAVILDIHPSNVSGSYFISTTVLPSTAAGSTTGEGNYQEGTTCTLTAATNEGYTFVNWSKDGYRMSTNSTYSFTVNETDNYQAFFNKNMQGDIVSVGSGTQINPYLPISGYDTHSMSQQIYTANEICMSGNITSIAFYNNVINGQIGRNIDIYMVHTDKTFFSSNSDWIAVTEADKVFSGEVWFPVGVWSTITLDTPFAYDGTSNMAIVVTDNTGLYDTQFNYPRCFVTSTNSMQSIYTSHWAYEGFDPTNPSQYSGTRLGVKNQIHFGFENGTPVTPVPMPFYETEIVEIGEGTFSSGSTLPIETTYGFTLTEQIYTAEEIGRAGTIRTLGFNYDYSEPLSLDNVCFALKHVSINDFGNSIDNDVFVNLSDEDFVYGGSLTLTAPGWVTITLNTPFEYDGTSNLIVACLKETPTSLGSNYKFKSSWGNNGYASTSFHPNSLSIDYTDLEHCEGYWIAHWYRPDIQIGFDTGNIGGYYTVYNGNATSNYVPVQGFYVDDYLKCEMVMPATVLSPMAGSDIHNMRFYLSSPATMTDWGAANFKIFMKEVGYTEISAYAGDDNATIVYEGSLDPTRAYMDIEFSTPYHYNGGNLLIGVYNTVKGSYTATAFQGTDVNGASVQGYNGSSLDAVTCNQRNFLPKTTFGYIGGGEITYYHVSVSANPAEGGTVTGGGDYPEGVEAQLTATANSGYAFVNWTQNGVEVSTEPTYSFVVNGDVSYVANFEESDNYELTVYDGITTSNKVPVYLYYFERFTRSQYIIPAADLSAMAGFDIQSIKWYSNQTAAYTTTTEVIVYLTEVGYTSISAYENTSDCQTAYQGLLTINADGTCTVNFYIPYHYNGGNLLIGCENLTTSSYKNVNWYGQTVTGASIYGNSVSSTASVPATAANFIPKTTFAYTEGGNVTYYHIGVSANPAEGGSVSGSGYYEENTTATLTATAEDGYAFTNWTKNGTVVSTNASFTLTVTEDADYVANFVVQGNFIYIGDGGSATFMNLPVNTWYNYSISQQIYTAAEIGTSCNITSVAFKNTGTEQTRSIEIYMKTTDKSAFESTTDWIPVSEANKVFSGTVTFTSSHWTTITFDTPFAYNGTSNVVILSNDITGDFASSMDCLIFDTNGNQALFVSSDDTMFNATNINVSEEDYPGLKNKKNQVRFGFEGGDIPVGTTQTTEFANGWNWWSSYVEADDLMAQLKTGLGADGKQIKSQTKFTMNYGSMWMGQLNSIENDQTYMVQALAPCSVDVTGFAVDPADYPITLNTGWKWIGFPSAETLTVTEALAGLIPTAGDQIKAQNSFSTYYNNIGWMGTLKNLTPGKGYMFKLNGASQTLVFPSASRATVVEENITADGNHWVPDIYAYPSNMTVLAVVELDDVELASENYELAAFADGECRGSGRLMYVEGLNRYMAFLTIAGDEAAELRFGLYDDLTDTECFDSGDVLVYAADAIVGSPDEPMVVRFRGTTGMDEWASQVQVFPNPVESGQNIRLSQPFEGKVQVEIINELGVETQRATSVQSPASFEAPSVPGVYTLRITVEGKETCYRKLIVK